MSSAETEADDQAEAPETDERREQLVAELGEHLGEALLDSHIRPGDDVWIRVDRDAWVQTAEIARDRMGFDFFDFLSAIDWLPSPYGRDMDAQEDIIAEGAPEREPAEMTHGYAGGETRFQLLARLSSLTRPMSFTLKADLPDDDLSVGTWTQIYAGANWHERETHEMFGIAFLGHPHLQPLYLPGDFEGHPLRKDFPLLARRVRPWPGIVDVEPIPVEEEPEDSGEGES